MRVARTGSKLLYIATAPAAEWEMRRAEVGWNEGDKVRSVEVAPGIILMKKSKDGVTVEAYTTGKMKWRRITQSTKDAKKNSIPPFGVTEIPETAIAIDPVAHTILIDLNGLKLKPVRPYSMKGSKQPSDPKLTVAPSVPAVIAPPMQIEGELVEKTGEVHWTGDPYADARAAARRLNEVRNKGIHVAVDPKDHSVWLKLLVDAPA